MKKRFTVRKSGFHFQVFDRFECKVARHYSHKPSAQSLCKYLNSQYKELAS